MNIQEIENNIKAYELEVEKLESKYLRASCPVGYRASTSFQDYDCIKGSRKEFDLMQLYNEIVKTKELIEIQKDLLVIVQRENIINNALELIPGTKDKIIFLKDKCNYNNSKVAAALNITPRQVRRLLNE